MYRLSNNIFRLIRAAPAHVVKSVVIRRLRALYGAMVEAYEFMGGRDRELELSNSEHPDFREIISKILYL